MMNDILELCANHTFEAFQVLDKRRYPQEYVYSKKLYNNLLEVCCCFVLIDQGDWSFADSIMDEIDKLWEDEQPLKFTVWAYRLYLLYKGYKNEKFDDRDSIDGERAINGNNIGEYIFNDFLYDEHYDMLKKALWDCFVTALDEVRDDYCTEE